MRTFIPSLATVLILGWMGSAPATAQVPGEVPVQGKTYSPAYHHFLNSTYTYRTFTALSPGYSSYNASPFSYQSFYVEPGYLHQRISPSGFEHFQAVPGYGGAYADPSGYSSGYTPGYVRQFRIPAAAPIVP